MLSPRGVRVWGTSRDAARLADLAQRHPSFTAVTLDLRDGDARSGRFAPPRRRPAVSTSSSTTPASVCWRSTSRSTSPPGGEQLEVMLVEPARLSHLALAGMLARNRGALVNISSLAVEFPLPFQSAYNMAKSGLSALSESLMIETAGTGVVVIDFRPGDYRTDFDRSVSRPQRKPGPRLTRAWVAFEAMMRSGPPPEHAAAALRRALLRHRSGTVRTGRFFQAVFAPFLARFGSLDLKRRVQARYFDV
jgi:hypothetical protein